MGNEASVTQGVPPSPGAQKCLEPIGGFAPIPAVGTSFRKCSPERNGGGEGLPCLNPTAVGVASNEARLVAKMPGVLEVCELLGSGSFSHVFRCRVVGEAEHVAVKLCTQDSNLVLAREASLLLGLSHVNLVRLHRVIEGPPVGLFLQLCGGGDLSELLHSEKYAERIRCVQLKPRVQSWLQISCAVEYLHSRTIIHRDIQPANCFLTQPPESVSEKTIPLIKVGDLSVSRHVDASRLTAGVGNCRYTAPEAFEDEHYGLPVDIYATGIIGHELCSGQVPYESPGMPKQREVSIIIMVADGQRPDPNALPAHPKKENIQALINQCWHQEPERRPTAEALVELLRQLLWIL